MTPAEWGEMLEEFFERRCRMTKLSIIYPFYENHDMLKRQLEHWRALPQCVLEQTEFILVDDASPKPMTVAPTGLTMQAFRVRRDIRWNQHGARNIGAHHARGEWILLTDIDHIVPLETLTKVLNITEPDIYTFERAGMDGARVKPHVNSFLMTRDRYWEIGGYDEDYRGIYGTDKFWRKRIGKTTLLPCPLFVYRRTEISDASTTSLSRDKSYWDRIRLRAIYNSKRFLKLRPRVLREPYDRIV